MAKTTEDRTRYLIRQHQINQKRVTQADVIRELHLASQTAFYRLFYRVIMEASQPRKLINNPEADRIERMTDSMLAEQKRALADDNPKD